MNLSSKHAPASYRPRYLVDDGDSYRPMMPPGARDQRTDMFQRISRDDYEPPRGSMTDVVNRSLARTSTPSSPLPHRAWRNKDHLPSEVASAAVREPPELSGYDSLSGVTIHRVHRPSMTNIRRMPVEKPPQWNRGEVKHGLAMYKMGLMNMDELERSWLQPSRKTDRSY